MQRRRFLTATAAGSTAALASPLARHVANVLGAYRVVGTFGSGAIAICRMAAKAHNRRRMEDGTGTWAIVACTDGRFVAGAESEVAA